MDQQFQVPRYGINAITISVEPPPPNDGKNDGPLSSSSVDWNPEHYAGNEFMQQQQHLQQQQLQQQQFYTGFESYPQPSAPQMIPRIMTSEEPLRSSPQSTSIWDARSPTSSDSGWSNPSSPRIGQFNDDFRDDGSDYLSDGRSYVSDTHYQQDNEFDIAAYLSLEDTTTSPPMISPNGFLSAQDQCPLPSNSLPNLNNPFQQHQSLNYASPYGSNQGSIQGSPTSSPSLGGFELGSGQYHHMGRQPPHPMHHAHTVPQPTHRRSTSDYLLPPSPTLRRARSHSRGSGSGPIPGHRSTISEGYNLFNNLVPDMSPESSMFLGGDLRGRGLARANTAPSAKAPIHDRGRSPYERPTSQASMNETHLVIPSFNGHGHSSISGSTTPDLDLEFDSPSPSSAKDVVATDAMVQASVRRRTKAATFFCSLCGNSFTTENSKKRHELSHSGIKPYSCSLPGCGQTFSNDDDRKRHENKSKKHAKRRTD